MKAHAGWIGVAGRFVVQIMLPAREIARCSFLTALPLLFLAAATSAQSNVTTQHYDVARTGTNTNETILTPSNVNTSTFGKLFSYPVQGWIYAEPLYMAGVTMGAGTAQAGTTHNVGFVATA